MSRYSVGMVVSLLFVWACGSGAMPMGTPDDPFDPGPRPPGSGYGSGSGSGAGSGGMPVMPMCEEDRRRCAHEFYYHGTAAMPSLGDEYRVEVRGDYRTGAWMDGEVMKFDGKAWRATVDVPWQKKTLYKFFIKKNAADLGTWLSDPENPVGESDGNGGMNSLLAGTTCANYSCIESSCELWTEGGGYDWRDTVLYFVFVDRFMNGNVGNDNPSPNAGLDPSVNWQGGDWAGVTQKIKDGYFTQLGVNALWLTVPIDQTDSTGRGMGDDAHIYTAYHGYWPRDLDKPESRFGTSAEWQELIREAHKAGIKVLIDYAMNHVHKDSPVYKAHMDAKDGWFNPLDLEGGAQCLCGSTACGWEGDKAKVCWFTDYLPDFNFANAAARAYSVTNALKWLTDSGADGFRLDAVKHIEVSWLTDLRARLRQEVEPTTRQHVYLVGETYTGRTDLIKSFVDPCQMLDGQFDFPLRAQVIANVLLRQDGMQKLAAFMDKNDKLYGNGLMSTFLSNHDVPRSIHFAQNTPLWDNPWADGKDRNFDSGRPSLVAETQAYERLGLGMALLWTNRGIPLLYYGDEIGLPGAGDPDNRRFMNWQSETYNAGQQQLLNLIKKLGAIRKSHSALRRGQRSTLTVTSDTWAYKMVDGSDTVYVVLNRSDQSQPVSGLPPGALKDELLGGTVFGENLMVAPRTVRILSP